MAYNGASTSASPARKKMRMSSPTYDDQLDNLDSDDFEVLDQIEFSLSQKLEPAPDTVRYEQARDAGCDTEFPGFASVASLHGDPFKTGSEVAQAVNDIRSGKGSCVENDGQRSPSPETEVLDYSRWLEPGSSDPTNLPGFRRLSANTIADGSNQLPNPSLGFVSSANALAGCGFSRASGTKTGPVWIEPSKAALELAAKKMREWNEKDDAPAEQMKLLTSVSSSSPQPSTLHKGFSRSILGPIDNLHGLHFPESPSPACGPSHTKPSLPSRSVASDNSKLTSKARSFKSPFIGAPAPGPIDSRENKSIVGSPLNPNRSVQRTNFSSRPHPLASLPIVASPERLPASCSRAIHSPPTHSDFPASAGFMTPLKKPLLAHSENNRPPKAIKAKFFTPFKEGMQPGGPGHTARERARVAQPAEQRKETRVASSREITPIRSEQAVVQHSAPFCLDTHTGKSALRSSGLYPQRHRIYELNGMGINASELSQINVETAIYYSFHISNIQPQYLSDLSFTAPSLGPSAALDELLRRGCNLATKEWVDNHWRLILWKLAGMVCLDPERELGQHKRWCWNEVMRQLLYRYERELNRGTRPPFKLITTHDAPASSPMVLCVSKITWSEEHASEDSVLEKSSPDIEVTDGWYRLRVQLDEPLTRAARRGLIKVGRKLAVAGAWLKSDRKEPAEVLQAYNSTKLVLSGNSSHLAPWHAKLGFQANPFIATLNSLTADGGPVAVMDLVVIKAYPIAFLEFKEGENGRKIREGPRPEAEELQVSSKWDDRRANEEAKLRYELELQWSKWEGFADRLERIAGTRFHPTEDDMPPDHVEDLFDELECTADVSGFIKRLTYAEAGWLAEFIRKKCSRDRELAAEEIEMDLKKICPPREVRNFRVLVVRDARTCRRPGHRKAQLTVWDVLNLSLTEGGRAGAFQEGERFFVTNLIPSQQSAWMTRDVDSEVYLSSRRDTRWIRIR